MTLVHYRNIKGDAYSRSKNPDKKKPDPSGECQSSPGQGTGSVEWDRDRHSSSSSMATSPFGNEPFGGAHGGGERDDELPFLEHMFGNGEEDCDGDGGVGGFLLGEDVSGDIDYEVGQIAIIRGGCQALSFQQMFVSAQQEEVAMPSIVDFSPCVDCTGGRGGTKVLLCLSHALSPSITAMPLRVSRSRSMWTVIPVTLPVSESSLRCIPAGTYDGKWIHLTGGRVC